MSTLIKHALALMAFAAVLAALALAWLWWLTAEALRYTSIIALIRP